MSGWSSLRNCPVDSKGLITVCELNSVLVGAQSHGSDDDVDVGRYPHRHQDAPAMVAGVLAGLPDVSIAGVVPDLGRPAALGDHDLMGPKSSPFLSVPSPDGGSSFGLTAVVRQMFLLGTGQDRLRLLEKLLEEAGSSKPAGRWSVGQWTAKAALGLARFLGTGSMRTSLTTKESPEELATRFSETRKGAVIKCLAWHPHVAKIAVAAGDDSVHVVVARVGSGSASPVILKYKQQRGVSCMAWRPFFASELAVGCSSGLLVWIIDPCSAVARPSAGCVSSLQSPGHAPVTSITWHSNGNLLASASPSDNHIIVWNTASETKQALWRFGNGGTHLVRWCPDPAAKCLLAATTSRTFRVWRTEPWVPERWNVTAGHLNCACWAPDGSALLFTTSEEEVIFCLKFLPNLRPNEDGDRLLESLGSAVPVMDLSKEAAASVTAGCKGGKVQSMRWNRAGERLVLSFQDADVLAVFRTQVLPTTVDILPLGYVVGRAGERPLCFEFLDQVPFPGALLTIAWSSGRVQHLPMFYTSNAVDSAGNCGENSFMGGLLPADGGFTPSRRPRGGGGGGGLRHQLSTSHLVNNTLNAQGEFEPHLFSSPAISSPN